MNDDTHHQASAVLAAFRYQLLQSLSAWLDLQPDEELWLEVSEDFSIVAGSRTDIQVKSSPKPLSLRSGDAAGALRRFWARASEGNDLQPQLVFISRGAAAHEQGCSFPQGAPGLLYWRAAALDADTMPLRDCLSTIFSGEPLGNWLSTEPNDGELRDKLLRRVIWTLQAFNAEMLSDHVHDRVATLLLRRGLPVSAADVASKVLLDKVFEIASRKRSEERRLTLVELYATVEKVFLPAALQLFIKTAQTGSGAVTGLLISALPPQQQALSNRDATVSSVVDDAKGEPIVWIHGARGVGKTTLARLIAHRYGGHWLSLDLRPVHDDPRGALAAWRELRQRFDENASISGVVIDDLNDQAYETLRSHLSGLIGAFSVRGGRVLVTGAQPPSPARLVEFGASERAVVAAPYFTNEELRELVEKDGGPPPDMVDGWAILIRITTRGGHPLLAAAKIASLRMRGWPSDALTEDIGNTSGAVRATQEEARRRLLQELPSEAAHELLRRVASIFDRADEELVRKLGLGDPPLSGVGSEMALLRGSWIEATSDGFLRLSPLISDLARDVTDVERTRWLCIAARHWAELGPLNERTLPLCFWNAFMGRELLILAHIANTMQLLPEEQVRSAAALLSPLTAMKTDRSLLPEHPPVAAMLRLLQMTVADAVDDGKVAAAAAARLLIEIDEIPHQPLRALTVSASAFKVLTASNIETAPSVLLEYTIRARAVADQVAALGISVPSDSLPEGDVGGFLFAYFGVRILSSERLLATVEALDGLEVEERNWLLDSFAMYVDELSVLFQGAWASEQRAEKEPKPILARYEQIARITACWHRPDVETEIAISQSVILDEMLGDQPAALSIIDRAVRKLGSNWKLLHQKAKVLTHMNRNEDAASILVGIEDEIGGPDGFGPSLALREGALAAARAGHTDDAVRLLRKAHRALENDNSYHALAAGVKIEEALVHWRARSPKDAILAIADALDGIEQIDPTASRQNERAHQVARYVVGMFWEQLQPFPGEWRQLEIGEASTLTGDEPLQQVDFKPLSDLWRMLALVEIASRFDVGIDQRSLAKQPESSPASIEFMIITARYGVALADGVEPTTLTALGLSAVSAAKSVQDLLSVGPGLRVRTGHIQKFPAEELVAVGLGDRILSILLDAMIKYRFESRLDGKTLEILADACAISWDNNDVALPAIRAASGVEPVNLSDSDPVALAYTLSPSFDVSEGPRTRLWRDLLLLAHTSASFGRLALERPVVTQITSGWRRVLDAQRFLLRNPAAHLGGIEASLTDAETRGLKGIARLLLAVAPAAGVSLGERWESFLAVVAGDSPDRD